MHQKRLQNQLFQTFRIFHEISEPLLLRCCHILKTILKFLTLQNHLENFKNIVNLTQLKLALVWEQAYGLLQVKE